MTTKSAPPLPGAFIWRRLHSLTGLWLVLYLILHLFTNSQAALPVGDYGKGFIKSVNDINQLPYLHVLEIILLLIPFAAHTLLGIQYLFTAKYNSGPSNGTTPSLPEYPRNHAYTWQRITSWILLVLITFHVIHMRFLEKPIAAEHGVDKYYITKIYQDPGVHTLADHLSIALYTPEQMKQKDVAWINDVSIGSLQKNQLVAVANNFAAAELLVVRETFKSPLMILLYTLLVLSACFHGFNGLWTFMISWGVTLSPPTQNKMRIVATSLMGLIAFLGLAAVWGTYWIASV